MNRPEAIIELHPRQDKQTPSRRRKFTPYIPRGGNYTTCIIFRNHANGRELTFPGVVAENGHNAQKEPTGGVTEDSVFDLDKQIYIPNDRIGRR